MIRMPFQHGAKDRVRLRLIGGSECPAAKMAGTTGFAAIDTMLAYWNRLRGGADAPSRAQVDPRQMSDVLPYSFIGEFIAPEMVRLRVAGDHLTRLMGYEVRGMPLTSMISPATRPEVMGVLRQVHQRGHVAQFRLDAAPGPAQPRMEAALMVLPLLDSQQKRSRVLGCLVSRGDPGRGPRRFALAAPPVLLPGAAAPCPPAPDMAAQRMPQAATGHHRTPHLRLVHCGD